MPHTIHALLFLKDINHQRRFVAFSTTWYKMALVTQFDRNFAKDSRTELIQTFDVNQLITDLIQNLRSNEVQRSHFTHKKCFLTKFRKILTFLSLYLDCSRQVKNY